MPFVLVGGSQVASQGTSGETEQPQGSQSTPNPIINQGGQLVYVRSHPTLGNVGAVVRLLLQCTKL